MNIPQRAKVGPFTYKVERPEIVDRCDRDLIGQCDHQAGVIRIERALTGAKAEEAFLHELIHAVNTFMEIGLSEKQTGRLSNGLYMVLKENGLLADGEGDGHEAD